MKPKYLTIAVLGISRAYFETFPPLFAYDGGGCGGGGGGGGEGGGSASLNSMSLLIIISRFSRCIMNSKKR